MASPNIQNTSNFEFGSNIATCAYGGANTAGNTSVVLSWNSGGAAFSSCVDSASNAYGAARTTFTDPSSGGLLAAYAAFGIVAATPTVTITMASGPAAQVTVIVEEPACSGVRGVATNSGAGTQPSVTVNGCQAGDIILMLVNANGGTFAQSAVTVTSTGGGSNSDFLLSTPFGDIAPFDGIVPSAGNATISSSSTAAPTNWSAIALALIPAGGAAAQYIPPKRAAVEVVADAEFRLRPIAIPQSPAPGIPPRITRRRFEDTFPQAEYRRRPIALPPTLTPDIPPRTVKRDFEDTLVEDRRARWRYAPPVAPTISAPLLVKHEQESPPDDEDANRIKAVPLPLNADTSPLQNRRATEQTIPDETSQRTRPPVAPSVDFAPLPSRRALEQIIPDEVANRFRQQPAPTGFDAAPLPSRRAVEQTVPDEPAWRFRQQPAPTGFDSAPLTGPKAREVVTPDEIAIRFRQQPSQSVDFAPLSVRRVTQDDTSSERATGRVYAIQQPAIAGPPLLVRRADSTDESADESARRMRAVPPPGTVDSPPSRNRRAAEELVIDERVFRPNHPVPQSGIAPGLSPLTMMRRIEELVPDERAKHVQATPSPQTADNAPIRNRRSTENVVVDESARRYQQLAASTDFAPLQNRRLTESATDDERSHVVRILVAPSVDFAPSLPRRFREETTAEQKQSRYGTPPASVDFAPLTMRRLRDEQASEERGQRNQYVQQSGTGAPLMARRIREDHVAPERITARSAALSRATAIVNLAPLLSRRATEEVTTEYRAIRCFAAILARRAIFVSAIVGRVLTFDVSDFGRYNEYDATGDDRTLDTLDATGSGRIA